MISLIRAELSKVTKNRVVSFFTIGLIPVLAFILLNLLTILGAAGLWITDINQVNWQEQVILTLLFANQLLAQALFVILGAVTFGGEYRWNTWKMIVPRSHRRNIVVSKCIVIAIAILFAIQATAILTMIGSWEVATFTGVPLVSGTWNNVGLSFWQQYAIATFALFCTYMIGATYASIAAIQTKSTGAGIVLGVIIAFADTVSQPTFALISRVLRMDFLREIPSFFPNYNIQNILSWVTTGNPVYRWNVFISILIVLLWIFAGIGIAVFLFGRRDID